MRVCIVGLDGVGYIQLKIWTNRIPLRNLREVAMKNCFPTTIIPPYTPSSWTSILTGVNPGKHGIISFCIFSRKSNIPRIRLNSAYEVKYPRIFEMLSFKRARSTVINVPLTYPVSSIVGKKCITLVSDWTSPRQFIWPKKIYENYREYLVDPPYDYEKYNDIKKYIDHVNDYLNIKLNLYLDLLECESWDLYVIIFSELDWIQHKVPEIVLGRNLFMIKSILDKIDYFISIAREKCDLLVVISDHGFWIKDLELRVNAVLRRNNLLKLNRYFEIVNKIDTILGYNLLPRLINKVLKRFRRHSVFKALALKTIDTRVSDAIMIEPTSWTVYTKRIEFTKKVLQIPGIVKEVHECSKFFWGRHVTELPNLIIIPNDNIIPKLNPFGKSIVKTFESDHSPRGFLSILSSDNDLNDDVSYFTKEHVTIYDLVPTILHYMGYPIPLNTDGKVMPWALKQREKVNVENYLLKYNFRKFLKYKSR